MIKNFALSFFLIATTSLTSQTLTGKQLLDKAIAYHDPNNNWSTFNGSLFITMEIPDRANRDSKIVINLPEEYFYVKAIRDTLTTEYTIHNDSCDIKLNGKSNLTDAEKTTHKLSCERANMYKNYYTYLYGLPMKLKDPGSIIYEKIEHKQFKGKDYLVLKVTYDEATGSDIWYFYFNPKTYAMEIYQFFRKDATGKQNNSSGEYILLSGEEILNGIKMPKNRAWYYNKNDELLGTDILKVK